MGSTPIGSLLIEVRLPGVLQSYPAPCHVPVRPGESNTTRTTPRMTVIAMAIHANSLCLSIAETMPLLAIRNFLMRDKRGRIGRPRLKLTTRVIASVSLS